MSRETDAAAVLSVGAGTGTAGTACCGADMDGGADAVIPVAAAVVEGAAPAADLAAESAADTCCVTPAIMPADAGAGAGVIGWDAVVPVEALTGAGGSLAVAMAGIAVPVMDKMPLTI